MIELVIKIPEEIRVAISRMGLLRIPDEMQKKVDRAIQRGTPLPKGHGKLKDADKISDKLELLRDGWNYYGNGYERGKYEGYDYALDEVMDAPTIIEAQEAESEE